MEDYFEFLNDLRESGQINMFGAAPVLQEVFGLGRREAQVVLANWMETFTQRGEPLNTQ